ncbi:MAG TPA: endonuclease/exonuclease/phosphatase family protein [Cyclobacteriaceae bacterium]|nr:endonuclease/exonuclease/phosphatase family protein [Cyclobacteriaceae bacterium]
MNLSYLIPLFLYLSPASDWKKEVDDLHVVTFNIRYANPGDGINRWEARVPIVEKYLTGDAPDIIGMQEAEYEQVLDVQRMLSGYAYLGTGRDDGKTGGEFTPIFYKKDRLALIEQGQCWLSETPDVPGSKSWDAAITRIVTWAKFKDNGSGKAFYFFNTHFDHMGVEARRRSAHLLSEKIAEISSGFPVVVTGDFNIQKQHPKHGNDLYENLVNTFRQQNKLMDAAEVSQTEVTTSGPTSTGFNPGWKSRQGNPIDYIFVNEGFTVASYRIDRIMEGDVFISDHWPVVAKLSFTE